MKRATVLAAALTLAAALALGAANAVLGATPPPLINYQGVLRDGAGQRLSGTFDVTFRFFDDADPAPPENEILVDTHTAANGNAVTVTGGVFNTHLGGGTVGDGSGAGTYTTLADVFGDFNPVYLQVEIGDEVFATRIRVVSAAYALNAHRLEDLASGQFLRSDAADSYTGPGALTFDGGTVLNVGGTLQLSGSAVTSSATELNRLDGVGPTVTPASLTALTDGSVADALHVHASTNAALLDGLDSAQFLRSDASGSFTSGTLTLGGATSLQVDGGITLNGSLQMDDDETGNQSLYFFDAGAPTTESLTWRDAEAQFDLSDDLVLHGPLRTTGAAGVTSLAYNKFGDLTSDAPTITNLADVFVSSDLELDGVLYLGGELQLDEADGDQFVYFHDDAAPTNESLAWSDAEDRFELSNELAINGPLLVGSTAATPDVYSRIGTGTPESTDMNTVSDLYISADLEVDSQLFLAGEIRMDDADGNQTIYFFDGTATNESFAWQETNDRFQVSNDLHVLGNISATGTKPFVQNHPERPDLSVVYVALEGDEVGTYTRGSARLAGGQARVPLGESFAWVTNPDLGLTAHVTPRGKWADLYVAALSTSELIVRGRDGSDAAFDYVVYGLRIGYEPWQVVQPRSVDARVPAATHWDRQYAGRDEMRALSALERHRRMHAAVWGAAAPERHGAEALVRAIGTFDPSADEPAGATAVTEPTVESSEPASSEPPRARAERPAAARAATSPAMSPAMSPAIAPVISAEPESVETVTAVAAPEALSASYAVSEPVEPGDVLVLDPDRGGSLRRGRLASDRTVVGVAAAAAVDGSVFVATGGILLAKVDAAYGEIRAGDLLAVSPTTGHAMIALRPEPGTILGKALEPLAAGTGRVRILVMLQ